MEVGRVDGKVKNKQHTCLHSLAIVYKLRSQSNVHTLFGKSLLSSLTLCSQ